MNKYEKLIERLAERACVYHKEPHKDDCYDCRKKKPILIGDILQKVKEATRGSDRGELIELISLWEDCGFTKSLQSIVEEVGDFDEKARDLFNFLISLELK